MHFLLAAMIAVNFWTVRGVPVPCHPVPVVVEDSQLPSAPIPWYPSVTQTALAAAYGPDAGSLCGTILMSHTLQAYRTADPALYCSVIVHEIGHIAGLQHSQSGVMAASGFNSRSEYPWDCRVTARRIREKRE